MTETKSISKEIKSSVLKRFLPTMNLMTKDWKIRPAIRDVRIKSVEGGLRFTALNMDQELSILVDDAMPHGGKINAVCSMDFIRDQVKAHKEVSFTDDCVYADGAEFYYVTNDSEDRPEKDWQELEEGGSDPVPFECLQEAARYASTDEEREVMQTVCLRGDHVYATDGRRLFLKKAGWANDERLIPSKAIQIVTKLKPTAIDLCSVARGMITVIGRSNGFSFFLRSTLSGYKFPNVDAVIPKDMHLASYWSFSPAERAKLTSFLSTKAHHVRVEGVGVTARLTLLNRDDKKALGSTEAGQFIGPELIANYDPMFLRDMVEDTDTIWFKEEPDTGPCLGTDHDNPRVVLMPMRV